VSASWQQTSSLAPQQRLDVLNLLNRTEADIGREAIDEGRRRIVVHGWPAQHFLNYSFHVLTGYALLSGSARASIEMCGGGFDRDLLDVVHSTFPDVDWWTRDMQKVEGGTLIRTLQMLRVHLPVAVCDVPLGAVLRNFEPHRDEQVWLEQNNAAFANHPEQGAWLLRDLDERTQEPWFDPSGFLLLEIEGRLAASCWTKVHELHPDRFGEIYVISVHPDFQGRGLGRIMATQGLEVLRRKGVSSVVLFVDESNNGARELYDSIGFLLEREDNLIRFT